MTGFLRRTPLSRRTFLRGAACAVGLPWLDAMVPALARPAPIRRAVFVFSPNGKKMDDWRPSETGTDFELPFLLEPFAAHRQRMLVLTGLDLENGNALGDGPGDHARAAASFLTTAHPYKTGGADIRNGVSIDQLIASRMRSNSRTKLPSLEVGMERGRRAGSCDSGYACAYSHHVSWASEATPVPAETQPRRVFRRLFGDPDRLLDPEAVRAEARHRRSVLDSVAADTKSLTKRLGKPDQAKLGEYLDGVRDLEKRLEKLERDGPAPTVEPPESLAQEGREFPERLALMYELCALALSTDTTRVITFMLGNAGSNRSYRFLDVPDGHHTLSHHRNDPLKIAKIRKINRFHTEQCAAFLDRLAREQTGQGDLLDSTLVLYGSGLADGNAHRHVDLPILLFGRGDRVPTGGQHLRAKSGTPLGNLHLSIAQSMGVSASGFGDATGPLFG